MSRTADLADVIDTAFAAALDDALWDDWARLATARLVGVGCAFCVFDAAAGQLDRFLFNGYRDGTLDDYLAHWQVLDPQVSYGSGLVRTTVYTSSDHVDLTDPATAAFVNWHKRVGGVEHHLTLAVQVEGRRFAGLAVHRATEDGPVPAIDRLRLEGISPDIERAMRLGFRHNRLLDDAFWDGIAAASGTQAALLIDETGRAIRLTDRAVRLLTDKPAVTLTGDRIACADPVAQTAVERVLGEAVRGVSPRSGAVRIGPAGAQSLIVVAYPLAQARRRLAARRAAALVLLVDPGERRRTDMQLYEQAIGLTRREAELACLLVGGHTVGSAAHVLGVSLATARVHLRHIFAKAGVDRQPELIRLLLAIGG